MMLYLSSAPLTENLYQEDSNLCSPNTYIAKLEKYKTQI